MTRQRAMRLALAAALAATAASKPTAELTPSVVFHLQDPVDGLCLGPHGFAPCDTSALWIVGLAKGRQSLVPFLHPTLEASCLDTARVSGWFGARVRLGSCKAKNSLSWNIKTMPGGAMVTAEGGKQCVMRQWNFAATQPCEFGYTALKVVETTIHDRGFLLATGDGTCFDGARFKLCDPKDPKLYWGAAVRFDSPRAEGYVSLFKFIQLRTDPGQKCLVRESSKRVSRPVLGDCAHSGAKQWSLVDGQLSHDKGKSCLARDEKTGLAKLQPCKDGYTPMSWTMFDDRGYFDESSRRSARLAQELAGARARF